MLLKYFYDEKLAQASYLVGCAKTGEALVIDPCAMSRRTCGRREGRAAHHPRHRNTHPC